VSRMSAAFIWALLSASATACAHAEPHATARDAAVADGATHNDAAIDPAEVLRGLVDGSWVFSVDRAWDGVSGHIVFPSDSLTDDDYKPTDQSPTYAVVLSEAGAHIMVGTTPFIGQRTSASSARLVFELSQGTFAGGRFVVWRQSNALQAELTIYGSGRPIVQSERGRLVAQP
jgi:hypothetical protein